MSNKAEQFLSEGQEVTIAGQPVKIQRQTIRHNLKFIRFIADVMKEANDVGELEFNQANVVDVLMNSVENRLVEAVQLIVPEIDKEQVMNAYFDELAEALEVYLKLNFSKVFQAVQMARAVQKKIK